MLFQLFSFWAAMEVIAGHGRLIEPPSRSTMWRYGFKTPPNYNDHELFCGGLSRMVRNGGKCGVCGDPSDQAPPRPNEVGGRYANGIVVRRYEPNGATIDVQIEITAYHKGHIEIKICPTNNPKVDPTQECLDENELRMADGSGRTKYYLPAPSTVVGGKYKVSYALPKRVTCSFCVLQWTYVAANNWGRCANGTQGIGCGHQETFRACADIAIGDASSHLETNEISESLAPKIQSHVLIVTLLAITISATFRHVIVDL